MGERAAAMAVAELWRHWAVINPFAQAGAPGRKTCVLDPETILLASLALADKESRLVDFLAWYAERVSTLLSVQRTRTLARAFFGGEALLRGFAHWAVQFGNDRRWARLAGEPDTAEPRRGKGPDAPRLDHRCTLMFRLRAGFGVGVKADLVAHLFCLRGEPRRAAEIAHAVGYTDKTARIALRELGLAGLVEETSDYPVRYAARRGLAESFVDLLYGDLGESVPSWCYWPQVFAVLVRVAAWARDPNVANNAYLASSQARDLFSEFEGAFRGIRVRMPRPEPHPGSAYLAVFSEFVEELGSWLEGGKGDE